MVHNYWHNEDMSNSGFRCAYPCAYRFEPSVRPFSYDESIGVTHRGNVS